MRFLRHFSLGNSSSGINPKRLVATWDRFQRTSTAMQTLAAGATTEEERARWVKMELALVLAEATGRRLSAIRHLRWEDIDFARQDVRRLTAYDKKRKEWIIPLPRVTIEQLRIARAKLGGLSGWIFAAEQKPVNPWIDTCSING
jgi:integrase